MVEFLSSGSGSQSTMMQRKKVGVNLLTPVIGAPVSLTEPVASFAWWREMDSEEAIAAALAEACGENC